MPYDEMIIKRAINRFFAPPFRVVIKERIANPALAFNIEMHVVKG
jgi:hypothetical protein